MCVGYLVKYSLHPVESRRKTIIWILLMIAILLMILKNVVSWSSASPGTLFKMSTFKIELSLCSPRVRNAGGRQSSLCCLNLCIFLVLTVKQWMKFCGTATVRSHRAACQRQASECGEHWVRITDHVAALLQETGDTLVEEPSSMSVSLFILLFLNVCSFSRGFWELGRNRVHSRPAPWCHCI